MLIGTLLIQGFNLNPTTGGETGGGLGPPGSKLEPPYSIFRRPVVFTQIDGLYRFRDRRVE